MINPTELFMTKLEMMHILQTQVYGCISAQPWLLHQKTKRKADDISKVSEIKQVEMKQF